MPENKIEEIDILNFALNMEYLEAEFYTYAPPASPLRASVLRLKAPRTAPIQQTAAPRREARRLCFPRRNPSFTILRHRSVPTNALM